MPSNLASRWSTSRSQLPIHSATVTISPPKPTSSVVPTAMMAISSALMSAISGRTAPTCTAYYVWPTPRPCLVRVYVSAPHAEADHSPAVAQRTQELFALPGGVGSRAVSAGRLAQFRGSSCAQPRHARACGNWPGISVFPCRRPAAAPEAAAATRRNGSGSLPVRASPVLAPRAGRGAPVPGRHAGAAPPQVRLAGSGVSTGPRAGWPS